MLCGRGLSLLAWAHMRARKHTFSHCPGAPNRRQERKVSPGLHRMGPPVPSAPPALWVLGCLALLLWLWVLCTACHRKQARRQPAGLQGTMMPVEMSLLRRPPLCILSKSDTRLHELHQGPLHRAAPRPASMDLRPQCLEVARDTTRPPAAFSHRELPRTSPAAAQPSTGPEATYSNVGLAAIPRASLAAIPVVWAGVGAGLTSSCARDGPEARPVVAEYACIHKLKGTVRGPLGLDQGKTQGTPATQVDILYSRISKPKRRDPRSALDQLDPKGRAAILTLGRNLDYEAPPLRGLSTHSDLENVYESIQELGLQPAAPSSS
ncbi:lck-interacting transmembrane adapter 1 isoform X2 [Pipistrellus kuhlii]|uniref:lck-interacting transmembrane adapter 1 isoform X2 n=1 Tax=Pipistrellus kuhlii TaxID=59472 RepID=UPI001E2716BD|nr:lck-interacting transmembrane adapter 1 isoform X2 [Pipistrellus kuhlii]